MRMSSIVALAETTDSLHFVSLSFGIGRNGRSRSLWVTQFFTVRGCDARAMDWRIIAIIWARRSGGILAITSGGIGGAPLMVELLVISQRPVLTCSVSDALAAGLASKAA